MFTLSRSMPWHRGEHTTGWGKTMQAPRPHLPFDLLSPLAGFDPFWPGSQSRLVPLTGHCRAGQTGQRAWWLPVKLNRNSE